MAKLSYLNLTNYILRRLNQSTITDVTTATGDALIITNLINEVQNEIFIETDWYSLYTTRTFNTVASTAVYNLASDFGRTIVLLDTTNDNILIEDVARVFDAVDPNADYTGTPTHFAIQGSQYRLYPIPAGAYTIRDRYFKVPTALTTNANTSDLPLEVENCIIHWVWYKMLEYKNKFEQADRIRKDFERMLFNAQKMNQKIINRMHIFKPQEPEGYLYPPKFPSHYGTMYEY